MNKFWTILIVIGLIIFAIAGGFITNYNRLVSFNENITGAWAQVETQLQRRNDLIPNLVNTVKGYMEHEKDVFKNIADARAKLAGAKTINEKVQANLSLDSALARLLVIVENYPNLKANENFIRLQDELAGTENRISVSRLRYNEIVRDYNILIKRFPSNVVARMTGYSSKDAYFKAEERAKEVPSVKF
jgi:LemA protein